MKFRILILFVFLFNGPIQGYADPPDPAVIRIFTQIYNQNYDEAENTLSEKKPEMDAFYYQLLQLDLFWWKYSMLRSKENAGNLKSIMESSDSTIADSTRQKMIKLIKISYRFRFEVKRLNFIEAMFLRSEISEQLEEIKKENLVFDREEKDLFDLYIALLDYSNNSFNPFFYKTKSDACKTSLIKIETYTRNVDLIVHTLARYFLGRIYMKLENHPELAKEQFKILSEIYPENSYFTDLAAKL